MHTVFLARKYEGKIPLRKLRQRLEYNIKKYVLKQHDGVLDWVDLAEYRHKWWTVVNSVMNMGIP